MGVSAVSLGSQPLRTSTTALLHHNQLLFVQTPSFAFPACRQLNQKRDLFCRSRYHTPIRNRSDDSKCWRNIERWNRRFFWQNVRPMRCGGFWNSYPRRVNGRHSGGWRRNKSSNSHRMRDDEEPLSWDERAAVWEKEFKAEQERFDKEFEQLRKQIDADPYGVLFGRRLHPFPFGIKEGSWSSFVRSLFGSANTEPSNAGSKTRVGVDSQSTEKLKSSGSSTERVASNDVTFEFDPISGRMVPKDTAADSTSSSTLESNLNNEARKPEAAKSQGPNSPQPVRIAEEETSPEDSRLSRLNDLDRLRLDAKGSPDILEEQRAEDYAKSKEDSGKVLLMGGPEQPVVSCQPGPSGSRSIEEKDSTVNVNEVGTSKESPSIYHFESTGRSSNLKENDDKTPPAVSRTSQKHDTKNVEEEDLDLLRANDIRAPFARQKTKQDIEGDKVQSRAALSRDFDSDQSSQPEIDVRKLRLRNQTSEPFREVKSAENKDTISEAPSGQPEMHPDSHHIPATSGGNMLNGTVDAQSDSNVASTAKSHDLEDKLSELNLHTEEVVASITRMLLEFNKIQWKALKRSKLHAPIKTSDGSSRKLGRIPGQYRILSYDSSTMKVKDVRISSAFAGSFTPIHPVEAIGRVNNLSNFAELLPALEAEGYEIVSGGADMLIFMKAKLDQTATSNEEPTGNMGSSSPSIHSPTHAARVEREAIAEAERSESQNQSLSSRPEAPTQQGYVPRQEADFYGDSSSYTSYDPETEYQYPRKQFSGRQKSHPIKKTIKMVFLTGGVTAASCYAIGVVVEYFRTGGQDGQGPQGFTGLEGR